MFATSANYSINSMEHNWSKSEATIRHGNGHADMSRTWHAAAHSKNRNPEAVRDLLETEAERKQTGVAKRFWGQGLIWAKTSWTYIFHDMHLHKHNRSKTEAAMIHGSRLRSTWCPWHTLLLASQKQNWSKQEKSQLQTWWFFMTQINFPINSLKSGGLTGAVHFGNWTAPGVGQRTYVKIHKN